jgi:hypothetical protein
LDIFYLIAVLGGGRKPNLFFECLEFQVSIPLFVQTGIVRTYQTYFIHYITTPNILQGLKGKEKHGWSQKI